MPWMGSALYLGLGGVVGQRTTLTGSTWPPYPGAGQGYWARKAGFYSNRYSRYSQTGRAPDPMTLLHRRLRSIHGLRHCHSEAQVIFTLWLHCPYLEHEQLLLIHDFNHSGLL